MNIFEHIDKKTIVIFGVVAVLLLGFFFYSLSDSRQEPAQITVRSVSPLDSALGRELLSALAELKTTRLDTSIFEDPVFKSLEDFGVIIAPLPVGRRNPFAPFEEEAGAKSGDLAKPKTSAGSVNKPAAPPKKPDAEGFDI